MSEYRIQLGPPQNDLGNNRGPAVGQFALQQALRKSMPDWFSIGCESIKGDMIPWLWTCDDAAIAVECHKQGRPFIVGPNMLFSNSRKPREQEYARIILDSPHCRLIFTESRWYAQLIRNNLCRQSKAKICVVPYPVSIEIDENEWSKHEVLVYAKSGFRKETIKEIEDRFTCRIFDYGHYERAMLISCAVSSSVCVYLSDDDRFPIAASEISLAGCPLIGIERGCPHVKLGLGVEVNYLSLDAILPAIIQANAMNRAIVRETARQLLNPDRIVPIIYEALEKARQ